MRIKTSMNSFEFNKNYEKNNKPSLTIPDQTMSIRTILERHSRGLSIEGIKTPIWDGEDNDLPDWRKLDLAERQELADLYTNELQSIKNKHSNPQLVDKNNERVVENESISGEPSTDL
jgi:glutathionyl-hydroquinone reductase